MSDEQATKFLQELYASDSALANEFANSENKTQW